MRREEPHPLAVVRRRDSVLRHDDGQSRLSEAAKHPTKPFRVYLPAHLRGFRLGCGSGDEPGRRRIDLKAGVVLQADEISNVTPKAQIVDVKVHHRTAQHLGRGDIVGAVTAQRLYAGQLKARPTFGRP